MKLLSRLAPALVILLSATGLPSCKPADGTLSVPNDTIFRESFESGTLEAWSDNYRSFTKAVILDPALAYAGSRALEVSYPKGADGGSLTRFLPPGYDHLKVSYRVRIPASWEGGTKLIMLRGSRVDNVWTSFGVGGNCPDGTDFVLANVVTRGDSSLPIRFYTYYPDMARESDGKTCYGRYGDGTGPGGTPSPAARYYPPLTLERDRWHQIALELRLNHPDRSDGWQRLWLNDTLRGEWADLRFRTVPTMQLNAVTLESSMSETAGGAPRDQSLLVDDVIVTKVP